MEIESTNQLLDQFLTCSSKRGLMMFIDEEDNYEEDNYLVE